jgi:putative protease
MGVSSLKIEGRLRKSDYVRNVVTAYRMMLDAPKGEESKILKQAKNVLSGSLGRKWSAGFTSEKSAKELINFEALGANGQLCGKITSCQENGFTVSTIRPLHIGDSIRIQASSGEEGVGLTITRMRNNGKIVKSVGRNSECFIFCDKEVAPKGRVFKISGPEGKKLKVTLPTVDVRKKVILDMEFCEHYINVTCANIHKPVTWRKNIQTQPAEKHSIDDKKLEELFKATNSDRYALGELNVTIDGNYFMPASQLKQLKIEFWNWLAEEIEPSYIQDKAKKRVKKFLKEYANKHLKPHSVKNKISYILTPQNDKINKKGIICKPIYQFNKKTDEVILPYFLTETKLERLKKEIKTAYDAGIKRFRVTSLFQFDLLKEYSDIVITTSYPFPVTNSFAVEAVETLGGNTAQAWMELEYTAITEMVDKSSLPVEVYRYGRPVILSTRAAISVDGDIADARSNGFKVVVDKSLELTLLLPEAVLSIPDVPNTTTLFDLTHAYWGEEKRSRFNFDREMV